MMFNCCDGSVSTLKAKDVTEELRQNALNALKEMVDSDTRNLYNYLLLVGVLSNNPTSLIFAKLTSKEENYEYYKIAHKCVTIIGHRDPVSELKVCLNTKRHSDIKAALHMLYCFVFEIKTAVGEESDCLEEFDNPSEEALAKGSTQCNPKCLMAPLRLLYKKLEEAHRQHVLEVDAWDGDYANMAKVANAIMGGIKFCDKCHIQEISRSLGFLILAGCKHCICPRCAFSEEIMNQ